jgi:hypothetical protein
MMFAVDALAAIGYYVVAEVDAILVSGLQSLVGLAALILLPLITPLA